MGDDGAEGSSATADGGQAAISLTPDAGGAHVCIFEMLQLEGSRVGGLLPCCLGSFLRYVFLKPCRSSFCVVLLVVHLFSYAVQD